MFKMGLHWSFGHLKHKLWLKEGSRVKLTIWLPTTKSQESTWFTCLQRVCDILLENSWRELQLCFRSHLDQRFARKIMGLQSCGSPNSGQKATWMWGSWPATKYTIRGKVVAFPKFGPWWVFPSSGRGESCVSVLPVARPSTKSVQTMH